MVPAFHEILEWSRRAIAAYGVRVDRLKRVAKQARDGHAGAFDALVEATYPQVWRFCAGILGHQSADDFAQETYVRVFRALPRYRGESSPQTWMLGIARHVCVDEIRARYRRDQGERSAGAGERVQPDCADQVVNNELVASLETDKRTAFVLTQLLGMSYEESARVCECPVGTIRSRVARARADLIALYSGADSPEEFHTRTA